ncbi:hypothetical protein [Paenibacillus sp. UNC499MF]|uniref:hypothetical protein n=1 Tax=Paenibacillus sp. UNC499MF TaxID=1502751 RepID=UPI00089FCF72|nr:hypothetical protein [Paenibacillus sp. UNC499MF]SEF93842.1 hypothetical protein SAMN02799616_01516 [Paenibacillus sp. UNC499MF]
MKYTGTEQVEVSQHHGRLRPVPGVRHYQAVRASRLMPDLEGGPGWTFHNAPMLAFWRQRFYLQYITCPVEENHPPARTMITSSADGREWTEPRVAFPSYEIPSGVYIGPDGTDLPKGSLSVMHQRMGFYTAADGRLLTLGFYGISPELSVMPNDGRGIGRVVREIYPDGSMGPIYFIRLNAHAGWDTGNTKYPFYTESPDEKFVEACRLLLQDKLATAQWWEEDQSEDGFYPLTGYKALSCYSLPDNKVAGIGKNGKYALSSDNGESWTETGEIDGLVTAGSKLWGQQTPDGKYALLYNPNPNNAYRWPLAAAVSEDGRHFDKLRLIGGEAPPRRYTGFYKFYGMNYVRGITPGNGTPEEDAIWVTYSMNKEDIWVARIPVPLEPDTREEAESSAELGSDVNSSFNGYAPPGHNMAESQSEPDHVTDMLSPATKESGGMAARPGSGLEDFDRWSVYQPKWSEIRLRGDSGLILSSRDPYDYVKVEKAFAFRADLQTDVTIGIRPLAIGTVPLTIELTDGRGETAFGLEWSTDGCISVLQGESSVFLQTYEEGTEYDCALSIDPDNGSLRLSINGTPAGKPFEYRTAQVKTVAFKVGERPFRVTLDTPLDGGDLSIPDEPLLPSAYCIRYVKIQSSRLSNHVQAERR